MSRKRKSSSRRGKSTSASKAVRRVQKRAGAATRQGANVYKTKPSEVAMARKKSQLHRFSQTDCDHISMTLRSTESTVNTRKNKSMTDSKTSETDGNKSGEYCARQKTRKMTEKKRTSVARDPESAGLVKREKIQYKQRNELKRRCNAEKTDEGSVDMAEKKRTLLLITEKFRTEQKKEKQRKRSRPEVRQRPEFISWKENFFSAVKQGDIKSVQKNLKEFSDKGFSCQPVYDEALIEASRCGHKRIVRLLLDFEASSKYTNSGLSTALLVAVEHGYFDVVKMLVVQGADVNVKLRNDDFPLMLAVEKGHSTQLVSHLLDAGASVDHQNRHGRTPAMVCVEKQDFDTLRILIESGADLSIKDSEGNTAVTLAADEFVSELVQLISQNKGKCGHGPLFTAVEKNCLELIKLVLDCEYIDVNVLENNRSALVTALLRGSHDGRDWNSRKMINPRIVELLMARGADLNQQAFCHPPLCLAAASGRTELVKLFLASGANTDVEDMNKMTPLMYAAGKGYADIINELILYHVNINYVNQMEYSALTYALAKGNVNCATVLLQNGSTVSKIHDTVVTIKKQQDASLKLILAHVDVNEIPALVLFVAVQDSNYNAAKCLIDHGMEVNVKQFSGETLLMEAPTLEIAELLIQNGADVNLCGEGQTHPLMHFTSLNYFRHKEEVREAIIDMLLKNGADPNRSDSRCSTALMKAVHYQREQITHLLLDAGAEVNKVNSSGQTALMIAAQRESSEPLVRMLLEKGAEVNVQDNSGNTALMYAAMNSVLEVIEILLDSGADVNIEDKKGNVALIFTSDVNIASLLCAHGADIDKANMDGKTALMFAAKWRRLSLLTLLIRQGADVYAVDKVKSASALSLVVQSGCVSDTDYLVIKELLEAGAANVSYQHCDITLAKLIIGNQRELVQTYIRKGAGPSRVCTSCLKQHKCFSPEFCDLIPLSKLSALDVALICGNIDLAKYLKNNLYLVQSDIFKDAANRQCFMHLLTDLERQESIEFFQNFHNLPKTMHELSFVTVSDLLGPFLRKDRVKCCELPKTLKNMLQFTDEKMEAPIQNDLRLKQNVERLLYSDPLDNIVYEIN